MYRQVTEENKKALILLLNLILIRETDPIIDLTYKNPFSLTECSEEKRIVMDILVETQSGEQIDIEMQVHTTDEFISRTLYYECDLILQVLEKGQDYDKLKSRNMDVKEIAEITGLTADEIKGL